MKLTVHCAVCGAMFEARREWQKFCSGACRQKAHRDEMRNAGYRDTGEVSRALPAHADAPFQPTKGHPVDAEGLPLVRIWGPNTISDFQLRNMGLERTGLTFEGGAYYRRAA